MRNNPDQEAVMACHIPRSPPQVAEGRDDFALAANGAPLLSKHPSVKKWGFSRSILWPSFACRPRLCHPTFVISSALITTLPSGLPDESAKAKTSPQ